MRWFLALLLLTGGACAQSQQPSPSAGETSKPPQSQSPTDQGKPTTDTRGTETNPLIVRSVRSKDEADADAADHLDKSTTDWWMKIFAGAAAFGVFIQAAIFWRMIGVTQRQLRGYISLEMDAEMRPVFNQGRTVIPLMMRNRGQTPAHHVHQWITVAVLPEPFPTPTPQPKKTSFTYVSLSPGQAIPVFAVFERTVTDAEAVELMNGKSSMFIWGTIFYRDVFAQRFWQRQKRTEFRLMLDVNPDGTSSGIRFCDNGNHAT
jgi:hypothetical protein